MKGKRLPVRTCIACRTERTKRELCRIVRGPDGIVLDPTGRAAGRGAYLCYDAACMKKLVQKRLLNKTFSEPVSPEVYTRLEEDFAAVLRDAEGKGGTVDG